MTMAYGPTDDDEESVATIRRAHELGVTMFDTAELYGMGTGSNEELLGRAVVGFRDEIVLARNATRLAENVSAAEVGMGSADLDRIREILPHGAFGSRYPASMMPKW